MREGDEAARPTRLAACPQGRLTHLDSRTMNSYSGRKLNRDGTTFWTPIGRCPEIVPAGRTKPVSLAPAVTAANAYPRPRQREHARRAAKRPERRDGGDDQIAVA